jgi:hypothetical protein
MTNDTKAAGSCCGSVKACSSAKTMATSMDTAATVADVAGATGAEGIAAGADSSEATSQILTAEQEIQALRNVHQFLSQFDRVPGFLTNKWSKALDAIAIVANSLIAKNSPEVSADADASSTEGTEATAESQVVTQ